MYHGIWVLILILANVYLVSEGLKIINGRYASEHEYPQMVQIQIRGRHKCGATLINKNTVLTAAHCVYEYRNFRDLLQVVFGEYDLQRTSGEEKIFEIKKLIIHKSYHGNKTHIVNDIALVKIRGSVSNDQYKYIKYAVLDTNSRSKSVDHCEVVGWGDIREGGGGPPRYLKKVEMDVIIVFSFYNK